MKHLYLIIFLAFGFFVSSNGAIAQTGIKSIQPAEITIYPNPADNHFSIMSKDEKISFLTIHNIVGKEIKTMSAKPGKKYEIQGLRRGIYIVRVYDENENMIKALRLSKT